MENVIIKYNGKNISFHDEPVKVFCFDILNNIIKINFIRYFNIELNKWINNECQLIIKNWEKANSNIHGSDKVESLEKNINILVEILSIDDKKNVLSIVSERIDGKVVTLYFYNPEISIIEIL